MVEISAPLRTSRSRCVRSPRLVSRCRCNRDGSPLPEPKIAQPEKESLCLKQTFFAKRRWVIGASLVFFDRYLIFCKKSLESLRRRRQLPQQMPWRERCDGEIQAANGKPLEGVTVSARDVEKTFTTSVFTDEHGNYFLS